MQIIRSGTDEESLLGVVQSYEHKGFNGQFTSLPTAMVQCITCHESSPAEQVPLLAAHRLEGVSDPSEQAVVVGLECPACGQLGTMVLPYGPGASFEDADVLSALLDDRDQSRVQQGM